MQVRFANRDEFAWDMGEKSYQPGDNLANGVAKAGQHGLRPGCNGYSAFITAFSRRMRQHREAAASTPVQTSTATVAGTGLQAPGEGLQAAL